MPRSDTVEWKTVTLLTPAGRNFRTRSINEFRATNITKTLCRLQKNLTSHPNGLGFYFTRCGSSYFHVRRTKTMLGITLNQPCSKSLVASRLNPNDRPLVRRIRLTEWNGKDLLDPPPVPRNFTTPILAGQMSFVRLRPDDQHREAFRGGISAGLRCGLCGCYEPTADLNCKEISQRYDDPRSELVGLPISTGFVDITVYPI